MNNKPVIEPLPGERVVSYGDRLLWYQLALQMTTHADLMLTEDEYVETVMGFGEHGLPMPVPVRLAPSTKMNLEKTTILLATPGPSNMKKKDKSRKRNIEELRRGLRIEACDKLERYCEEKTREIVTLTQPRLLVLLGRPAQATITQEFRTTHAKSIRFVDATHPSAGPSGTKGNGMNECERELKHAFGQYNALLQ